MSSPWGSIFRPVDSSGRESRTLFFVSMTWSLLCIRFITDVVLYAMGHITNPTTLTEFGGTVTAILGIWLGRTWLVNQQTNAVAEQEQEKKDG